MASATLTPYKNNASQTTFTLVTTSDVGSTYKVAGRDLACPKMVEIRRKLTPPSSKANDVVTLRVSNTGRNATTGYLAAGHVKLEISIPKDTATITSTVMLEMLAEMSSLLNESTAMEATTVARTALIEGRDL